MTTSCTDWVRTIHAGPLRMVLVTTGGGAGAAARLLAEPGASRTVLEVAIPYAQASHTWFVPGLRGGAVSRERAQALADRAYDRAVRLAGMDGLPVGVACTAALATDRVRRGEEKAYICLRFRDRRVSGCLQFAKGSTNREEQEHILCRSLLSAVASAEGGIEIPGVKMVAEPVCSTPSLLSAPERWVLVHGDGQWALDTDVAPILYPGSFNPLHRGHIRLARTVARVLHQDVDLEISVRNADKPPLADLEVDRRLAGIQGRFRVVLTGVPTFLEKARLFPGRIFIVGYDTAYRIIDTSYYGDDVAQRDAAFREIRSLGCRFVIAGRRTGQAFSTLADLAVPEECADLFDEIGADRFREDISATALRGET